MGKIPQTHGDGIAEPRPHLASEPDVIGRRGDTHEEVGREVLVPKKH